MLPRSDFDEFLNDTVVVFLVDRDALVGKLYRTSEACLFVEEQDDFGQGMGVRHLIPWESVLRVSSFEGIYEEEASSPDWVAEILEDESIADT